MKPLKSGFTVLGFSKDSFGCCALHSLCQLGKDDCAIEEHDPEAKDYCHCYQRNHHSVSKKQSNHQEDTLLVVGNDGQLSLF